MNSDISPFDSQVRVSVQCSAAAKAAAGKPPFTPPPLTFSPHAVCDAQEAKPYKNDPTSARARSSSYLSRSSSMVRSTGRSIRLGSCSCCIRARPTRRSTRRRRSGPTSSRRCSRRSSRSSRREVSSTRNACAKECVEERDRESSARGRERSTPRPVSVFYLKGKSNRRIACSLCL